MDSIAMKHVSKDVIYPKEIVEWMMVIAINAYCHIMETNAKKNQKLLIAL